MRPYIKSYEAIGLALLATTLAFYPSIVGSNQYLILLGLQTVLIASIALAWNIIGGYAGQLDLSAFAYIGLGGIIAAELLNRYSITPWIGMPIGAAASALLATAIGYPLFRFGVREVWYALSTAALTVILHELTIVFLGSFDYYLPMKYGTYYLRFRTWNELFYFSIAILIGVLLVNIYISRSKIGYYLKAIREDEEAAEAIGIDTRRYKLLALIVYATILGFIGYIYVSAQRTYSYKTFDSAMSIYIAIIGIIGGLGSISGVMLSAVILHVVGEYLRGTFGGTLPGLHYLIYGIILIAVGIARPYGLASVIDYLKSRVKFKSLYKGVVGGGRAPSSK